MFSRNLFAGTWRLWRAPIGWWAVGLFLYVFADGWLVSIVARNLDVSELMASMPNAMLQTFMGAGAAPELARGAYGGFLFYFGGVFFGSGPIFAALFAMFVAPALLAGEWERGSLDALLARPVSRRAYGLTRFAVFSLATILVALVVFVAHVLVIGPIAGFSVPVNGVAEATGAWGLMALAFGAVGFLVAAATLRPAAGTGAVLALLLLMLVLNVAGLTSEAARPLGDLSLFKYWRPSEMLFRGTADAAIYVLSAGIAIVGLAVAALVFERRDLV